MYFPTILTVLTLAIGAFAQTKEQIEACANTIILISYESPVTFRTDDDTPFAATWIYGRESCLIPDVVPVRAIRLRNNNSGSFVSCQVFQFDETGMLTSECLISHAQMAIYSRDHLHTLWTVNIALGVSPTRYEISNDFIVLSEEVPVPSLALGRRDRRLFQCPKGQLYCPKGLGEFQCQDVTSDISSCGGCPGTDQAVDCTSISGVDGVSCRHSRCYVTSCETGFQVSPDRRGCIRHGTQRRGGRGRRVRLSI